MVVEGIREVEIGTCLREEARGWSVKPIPASGLPAARVGEIHVVSVMPGTSRGHHVHGDTTEWLLLFGGPATLIWRDPEHGTARELHVEGGTPRLFEIPAGVAHAILNHGESAFYLVAFYDRHEVATEACTDLHG